MRAWTHAWTQEEVPLVGSSAIRRIRISSQMLGIIITVCLFSNDGVEFSKIGHIVKKKPLKPNPS